MHRRPIPAILAMALVVALLGACAPRGATSTEVEGVAVSTNPELATDPSVEVVLDIPYTETDGVPQLLDACLPPDFDPVLDDRRPGILVVHGGSWARGSKNDIAWRAVCQWLAKAGYPTFNVDYRLAPTHPFPAAIDDVTAALTWVRDPVNARRFGVDPDRVGALGGSAGGNLVSLLGTLGTGELTGTGRVAAVVELSAPIDLTGVAVTDDFAPVQLSYLACTADAACPNAGLASPNTWIDRTDPPFFVAHSTEEMIPLAQASMFVTQLRDAGIDVEYVTVTGTLHSLAMIDADLKERILSFLDRTLGETTLAEADARP